MKPHEEVPKPRPKKSKEVDDVIEPPGPPDMKPDVIEPPMDRKRALDPKTIK
jgi:hypothetical protein